MPMAEFANKNLDTLGMCKVSAHISVQRMLVEKTASLRTSQWLLTPELCVYLVRLEEKEAPKSQHNHKEALAKVSKMLPDSPMPNLGLPHRERTQVLFLSNFTILPHTPSISQIKSKLET